MRMKKLLVYLLTASIMLESVLPVYASNTDSSISTQNVEVLSTVGTDVSENTPEEATVSENTVVEETTVSEDVSETGIEESSGTEEESTKNEEESAETEEESTGEGTGTEEESTKKEESAGAEEESTEEGTGTEEESTKNEEESAENEKESTEESTETEDESLKEDSVSENSISQNDVMATTSAVKELDYILGREMTAEEIVQQQLLVPELVPLEPVKLDTDDLYAGMNVNLFSELEESYDSRNQNIITGVRNQNPWGTCWAFATFAALESSLVKQGLEARESIDLSERHLAYFTANTGYDALGNASEDTMTQPYDSYYLESGGNLTRAAMRLMNWQGAAAEAKYPYVNSYDTPPVIAKENAQDIVATPQDIYFIPTQNASTTDETAVIKNLIKNYGCVAWSYYHDDTYYNSSTGGYNCTQALGTNHAITLVGWDNNYSKNNFPEGYQPENDGAWIVKNSWGSSWGKEGYFYISYEDATLGQGNDAGVIIAGEADEFDNNYFYSNGRSYDWYSAMKMAQVFEAKSTAGQEILKAVSFMLASANATYEIQVYKNPVQVDGVVVNPESGEAMYATPVQGETGYAGLYTVDVPQVTLKQGDTFAVVVSFSDSATVWVDKSDSSDVESVNVTNAGQSFVSWSTWSDLHTGQYSLRMNAFTVDVSGNVPILSYKITKPVSFTDTQKNRISWTECIDVTGYEIYRSESADGTYTKIGSAESGTSVYIDALTTEQWNTTYYYKVKAVFANTTTESEVLEVPGEVTLKMSGVAVTTGTDGNVISWTQVAGADGYEIERKLSTEETFSKVTTITGGTILSYTDQLGATDSTYEYRVRAYKGSVYTLWSDIETADNVKVELYNYGTSSQKIRVSWDALEEAANYTMRVTRYTEGWRFYWDFEKLTNNYCNVDATYFDINNSTAGIVSAGVGEELIFDIIPLDSSGAEITPNPYKSVKMIWTPMEVLSVSNTYSSGNATFTWTGAVNAEFIDVYRSTEV